MLGLPDSELTALRVLRDPASQGNWKASLTTTVGLAAIRQGIDEDAYLDLVLGSNLGARLRDSYEYTTDPASHGISAEAIPLRGGDQRRHRRRDIRGRAERLALRVLWSEWPDTTTRVVGLALVGIVIERGAYTFDCSARFLAAQAGIADPEIVSRARRSLTDLRLITVTGKGRALRRVRVDLDWCVGQKTYKQITAE